MSTIDSHPDTPTAATTTNGNTTTASNSNSNQNSNKKNYYEKGSVELAVETPVLRKRLETRGTLTHQPVLHGGAIERLVIVLVGLPARGKSFIARKLLNYMLWRGSQCRIFNVGKYRRNKVVAVANESQQQGGGDSTCSSQQQPTPTTATADFFDDSNQAAAQIREEAAQLALNDALEWLEGTGMGDDDKNAEDGSNHSDDTSTSTTVENFNDDALTEWYRPTTNQRVHRSYRSNPEHN